MHQVQAPVCGHVTNPTDREFNLFLPSQFEDFAEKRFRNENNVDPDMLSANATNDDSTKRIDIVINNPAKTDTIPPIPSKTANIGETRTSVFDDSDYDEVIDFMMSSTIDSAAVFEQSSNEKSKLNDDSNIASTDDANASKRSSASSVSTTSSSTSGVESGEEKSGALKYADLDIAKILHTKKRIHRILQSPPGSASHQESQSSDSHHGQNQSRKKKSFYPSKRSTHYGTLGSRSKSNSSVRYSRPASSGLDDVLTNAFSSDSSNSALRNSFRLTQAEQDTEDLKANRNTDTKETNRLSKISLSSFNSDKGPQSPQKSAWKPWKKLVNNNNTPKSPSHDAGKTTIRLNHNSNWNNNSSQFDSSSLHDLVDSSPKTAKKTSEFSLISTDSQPKNSPPKRFTNTLMRRFSRKSSSRSRSNTRRRSLPAENVLGVNPTSRDLSCFPNHIEIESQQKKLETSDKIEHMVLVSVQNRHEEEKSMKKEKPRKSSSIRKRFFSFTRKRNSSQERKTMLKQISNSCDENQTKKLTKTLSCSSPQLSAFAVNSSLKSRREQPRVF